MLTGTVFADSALQREDLQWLQRISYGVDSATLEQYHRLGRRRYLDAQLRMKESELPPPIQEQIAKLDISHADIKQWLAQVNSANQQINTLQDDTAKQDARKALNDRGNQLSYEASRRHLLNAIYSPAQLREQLVWFWLNHFSVFQYKANLR